MTRNADYPRRLKRHESFLGIHFDFHAGQDCTQIGKAVTRRMVERIIEQVRPDYIQCDCKGFRGVSSYPAKVGNAAPGFVRDPLKIWREVTAKHGVALHMHYAGTSDVMAVKKHPSWARVDQNGERHRSRICVFSPYVDKLLIPQWKELNDIYGVDGVWCDSDPWANEGELCWCRKTVKAFRDATGIQEVPKTPEDPHFIEYLEFYRDACRRYMQHYVTEMHKHNPDFQITSNWAYSSRMPERAKIDIDYLSGDFSMRDSVNAARFEARCLANQGKPWDLMAWGFVGSWWADKAMSTKDVVQLQQEAAVVLSLGGGFQAYFKQKKDGSIPDWQMTLMAETAKFCRARQKICHRAQPVPQVALLYSGAAFYKNCEQLFAPWQGGVLDHIQGVLRMLLDSQYSTEILMEHHLEGRMHTYPLIVVPEWNYLDSKFRKQLLSYVENGGNLLLIGPEAAAIFRKELKISLRGKPQERPLWVEHAGRLAGLETLSQDVRLGKGAIQFGNLYAEDDLRSAKQPAASIVKYGKGKIAATYTNLGRRYLHSATATARKFLAALVAEVFPEPMVEVSGSHFVDVVLNQIDGKLAVNLVNTAGHPGQNVYTYDDIPPVGPLDIRIRTDAKPMKVSLQPENRKLNYTYSKGQILLTIERLDIHGVILVE